MRWKKRRKDPEAPAGVRVIAPDGREFPCGVLRDGDDEDGCAVWVVVPREDLPPVGGGWMMAADVLPGRSMLVLRLSRHG